MAAPRMGLFLIETALEMAGFPILLIDVDAPMWYNTTLSGCLIHSGATWCRKKGRPSQGAGGGEKTALVKTPDFKECKSMLKILFVCHGRIWPETVNRLVFLKFLADGLCFYYQFTTVSLDTIQRLGQTCKGVYATCWRTPLDNRKAPPAPPVNGGICAVHLDHWQGEREGLLICSLRSTL